MTEQQILVYSLESALCMVLFFLLYFFLLRKETFFRANRLYLLATLLGSLVIPALNLGEVPMLGSAPTIIPQEWTPPLQPMTFSTSVALAPTPNDTLKHSSMWNVAFEWHRTIFLVFAAFYFILFLRILGMRIRASELRRGNGCTMVISERNIPPFSFWRYFFISRKDLESEAFPFIAKHEQAHIAEFHSLDLLLVNMLKCVFWFNPMIYFYEWALRENHEFTADSRVVREGFATSAYTNILAKYALGRNFMMIINTFGSTKILRRFQMLKQTPYSKRSLVKFACVLPAFALLVGLFSCEKSVIVKQEKYDEKTPFFPISDRFLWYTRISTRSGERHSLDTNASAQGYYYESVTQDIWGTKIECRGYGYENGTWYGYQKDNGIGKYIVAVRASMNSGKTEGEISFSSGLVGKWKFNGADTSVVIAKRDSELFALIQ